MVQSDKCTTCGDDGPSFQFSSVANTCLKCYEERWILEKLAELEHIQWSHWTKHMLNNMTPENIDRWRRQIATPYSELTEKEKDSDREWARRVLEITNDKFRT